MRRKIGFAPIREWDTSAINRCAHVSKSIHLTLHGDNVISESRTAANPRGDNSKTVLKGKLHEPIQTSKVSQVSWRVESDNKLVRTWDLPQHVEEIEVSVSDGKNCRAEISYRLKAGFNEYRLLSIKTKQPMFFVALSAHDIICTATD